jgi:hypothetical protein
MAKVQLSTEEEEPRVAETCRESNQRAGVEATAMIWLVSKTATRMR